MSKAIRDMKPWPAGLPLPAGALTFFYHPGEDDEFNIDPARFGAGGSGETAALVGVDAIAGTLTYEAPKGLTPASVQALGFAFATASGTTHALLAVVTSVYDSGTGELIITLPATTDPASVLSVHLYRPTAAGTEQVLAANLNPFDNEDTSVLPRHDEYTTPIAGAQAIVLTAATFVYSVALRGVNGTSDLLSAFTGWSFANSQIKLLAAANVQAQRVLEIVHNGAGIVIVQPPTPTPRVAVTPATIWDNVFTGLIGTTGAADYHQWSAESSLHFTTPDTYVDICVINEGLSAFPRLALVTVYQNGSYFATLTPASGTAEQKLRINGLTANADIVVVGGGNTGYQIPNGDRRFYAVPFTAVEFPTTGTLSAQPLGDVAVYRFGDSTDIGDGASVASRTSRIIIARQQCGSTYRIAAAGYGSLYPTGYFPNDAAIDAHCDQVVAFWATTARKVYQWNAGTNNFHFMPAPPATVATILRKICLRLISLVPDCELLICGLQNRGNYTTALTYGTGADYSAAFQAVALDVDIAPNANYYDPYFVLDLATDFYEAAPNQLHFNDQGQAKVGAWDAGIYLGTIAPTTAQTGNGQYAAVGTTVPANAPQWTYPSDWQYSGVPDPNSGITYPSGGIMRTGAYNSVASLTIAGRQADLEVFRGTGAGIIEVAINGGPPSAYDLSSASPQSGVHIITPSGVNNGGQNVLTIKKIGRGTEAVVIGNTTVTNGTLTPTVGLDIYTNPTPATGENVVAQDVNPALVATPGQLVVANATSAVLTTFARGTKGLAVGADGGTSFRSPLPGADIMCGLHYGSMPTGFPQLAFVAYVAGDNVLQIYESGVSYRYPSLILASTDVITVAVESGSVVYRRNGALVRPGPAVPAGVVLYPIADLNKQGERLTNWTVYSSAALVAI